MKLFKTLKSYWEIKEQAKQELKRMKTNIGAPLFIRNTVENRVDSLDTDPYLIVQLVSAVNGKLLQYRKRDVVHDRWFTHVYIVRPDESLADAMATILVLTGRWRAIMNYEIQTSNVRTNTVAGVARSAMLVDLNISVYSGRKQDKSTQAEVTSAKGSGSKKAASVYKNLFAECKELENITKFQARARAEHYRMTLPWNDHGARLLPTISLMDYQKTMGRFRSEFDLLVEAFLDKYDTLVAAAAFQLGTLFDRGEYLTRNQVAQRFRMDSSFTPLPTAGDFRLDVESTVQRELVEQYERKLEEQLTQAGCSTIRW